MCGSVGQYVNSSTVEHICAQEFGTLEREIMSACLDSECEIVYFSSSFYPLFFEREISTEIGFKASATKSFVCYCHKVTKEDIVKDVLNNNSRTIKDIIHPHGDIILNACEKLHPLGCDCVKDIRRIINDTLLEHKLI